MCSGRVLALKKCLLICKYREQTAELNSCRNKLDVAVAKIKAKDGELAIADKKLHTDRTWLQKANDAKSALEKVCQDQKKELSGLQDTLTSLEGINKQLSSSCKEYEKQIEKLQLDKKNMQAQLKEAQKVKVNKELTATLKEEVKKLKAEMKKQKQEYETRIVQLETSTIPKAAEARRRKLCQPKSAKKEAELGAASQGRLPLPPSSSVSKESDSDDDISCGSDSDFMGDSSQILSSHDNSEIITTPRQNSLRAKEEFIAPKETSMSCPTLVPVKVAKQERSEAFTDKHVHPDLTAEKKTGREITLVEALEAEGDEASKERTLSMSSVEDLDEVLSKMTLPSHHPMLSPFKPSQTLIKSPIKPKSSKPAEVVPSNCRRISMDKKDSGCGDEPQALSLKQNEQVLPQPPVSSDILGEISSSSSEDENDQQQPLQVVSTLGKSEKNIDLADPTPHPSISPEKPSTSSSSNFVTTVMKESKSAVLQNEFIKSDTSDNTAETITVTETIDAHKAKLNSKKKEIKSIEPKLQLSKLPKKVIRRAALALPDLNLVSRKYPIRDSQGISEAKENKKDSSHTPDQSESVESRCDEIATTTVVDVPSTKRRIARVSSATSFPSNKSIPIEKIFEDIPQQQAAMEESIKQSLKSSEVVSKEINKSEVLKPTPFVMRQVARFKSLLKLHVKLF
ncbi:centrosomal protein of 63 kDa-like [Watersipora subatra]|uniref:centrosomal protein of 63 kDa-like n=1 Tax=Watersipora subatra TaxID=2589382 RepID=UPI00355B673D